jgi:beta-glucosidase
VIIRTSLVILTILSIEPLWFVDLGGFEKEENIKHFLKFSIFTFNEYSSKVRKWCTINEPNVYSVMGWSTGVFPPAKQDNALAGKVMSHLANAHVQVYQALKVTYFIY